MITVHPLDLLAILIVGIVIGVYAVAGLYFFDERRSTKRLAAKRLDCSPHAAEHDLHFEQPPKYLH